MLSGKLFTPKVYIPKNSNFAGYILDKHSFTLRPLFALSNLIYLRRRQGQAGSVELLRFMANIHLQISLLQNRDALPQSARQLAALVRVEQIVERVLVSVPAELLSVQPRETRTGQQNMTNLLFKRYMVSAGLNNEVQKEQQSVFTRSIGLSDHLVYQNVISLHQALVGQSRLAAQKAAAIARATKLSDQQSPADDAAGATSSAVTVVQTELHKLLRLKLERIIIEDKRSPLAGTKDQNEYRIGASQYDILQNTFVGGPSKYDVFQNAYISGRNKYVGSQMGFNLLRLPETGSMVVRPLRSKAIGTALVQELYHTGMAGQLQSKRQAMDAGHIHLVQASVSQQIGDTTYLTETHSSTGSALVEAANRAADVVQPTQASQAAYNVVQSGTSNNLVQTATLNQSVRHRANRPPDHAVDSFLNLINDIQVRRVFNQILFHNLLPVAGAIAAPGIGMTPLTLSRLVNSEYTGDRVFENFVAIAKLINHRQTEVERIYAKYAGAGRLPSYGGLVKLLSGIIGRPNGGQLFERLSTKLETTLSRTTMKVVTRPDISSSQAERLMEPKPVDLVPKRLVSGLMVQLIARETSETFKQHAREFIQTITGEVSRRDPEHKDVQLLRQTLAEELNEFIIRSGREITESQLNTYTEQEVKTVFATQTIELVKRIRQRTTGFYPDSRQHQELSVLVETQAKTYLERSSENLPQILEQVRQTVEMLTQVPLYTGTEAEVGPFARQDKEEQPIINAVHERAEELKMMGEGAVETPAAPGKALEQGGVKISPIDWLNKIIVESAADDTTQRSITLLPGLAGADISQGSLKYRQLLSLIRLKKVFEQVYINGISVDHDKLVRHLPGQLTSALRQRGLLSGPQWLFGPETSILGGGNDYLAERLTNRFMLAVRPLEASQRAAAGVYEKYLGSSRTLVHRTFQRMLGKVSQELSLNQGDATLAKIRETLQDAVAVGMAPAVAITPVSFEGEHINSKERLPNVTGRAAVGQVQPVQPAGIIHYRAEHGNGPIGILAHNWYKKIMVEFAEIDNHKPAGSQSAAGFSGSQRVKSALEYKRTIKLIQMRSLMEKAYLAGAEQSTAHADTESGAASRRWPNSGARFGEAAIHLQHELPPYSESGRGNIFAELPSQKNVFAAKSLLQYLYMPQGTLRALLAGIPAELPGQAAISLISGAPLSFLAASSGEAFSAESHVKRLIGPGLVRLRAGAKGSFSSLISLMPAGTQKAVLSKLVAYNQVQERANLLNQVMGKIMAALVPLRPSLQIGPRQLLGQAVDEAHAENIWVKEHETIQVKYNRIEREFAKLIDSYGQVVAIPARLFGREKAVWLERAAASSGRVFRGSVSEEYLQHVRSRQEAFLTYLQKVYSRVTAASSRRDVHASMAESGQADLLFRRSGPAPEMIYETNPHMEYPTLPPVQAGNPMEESSKAVDVFAKTSTETTVPELPEFNIRQIVDRVYSELEKKIRFERQRRGLF